MRLARPAFAEAMVARRHSFEQRSAGKQQTVDNRKFDIN